MDVASDEKVRKMRILGWFMVGIGAFLVVLAIGVGGLLVFESESGSSAMVARVLVVLAMLIVIGIVCVATGISAVRSGRMRPWLMAVLGMLIIFVMGAAGGLLGQ
jgi:hypothetical protein